jgi:hypothetical protein
MLKGNGGRQKSGYVLMCSGCASQQQDDNKWVLGVALAVMAVIALVVVLARGH